MRNRFIIILGFLLSICNDSHQLYSQESIQFQFIDEDSVELPLIRLFILKKGEQLIDTLSSFDGVFIYNYSLTDRANEKTKIIVLYAYSYSEIIYWNDMKGKETLKVVMRRIPDEFWWIDKGNDVATCHHRSESRKIKRISKMIKKHNQ